MKVIKREIIQLILSSDIYFLLIWYSPPYYEKQRVQVVWENVLILVCFFFLKILGYGRC